MTREKALDQRALRGRLALTFAVALGSALLLIPTARSGSESISVDPASPDTLSGVVFTVSTGGGNRDYASVAVTCSNGADVLYATVLTVQVEPKGTGTSQRIYPPASTCTADLEKQMSIGHARVLASVDFTVDQA